MLRKGAAIPRVNSVYLFAADLKLLANLFRYESPGSIEDNTLAANESDLSTGKQYCIARNFSLNFLTSFLTFLFDLMQSAMNAASCWKSASFHSEARHLLCTHTYAAGADEALIVRQRLVVGNDIVIFQPSCDILARSILL